MEERISSIEERLNTIQEHLEGLPDIIQRCLQQHQQKGEQQRHHYLHPEDAMQSGPNPFTRTSTYPSTPYYPSGLSGHNSYPSQTHPSSPTSATSQMMSTSQMQTSSHHLGSISPIPASGSIPQGNTMSSHKSPFLHTFPTRSASAPTNS